VQATCPQCGNRLMIDDGRVPDRPFSVRCPKCQGVLKLPGKGAAALPPAPAVPAPAPVPALAPAPVQPPASSGVAADDASERLPSGPPAAPAPGTHRRREGAAGRALVALPGSVTGALMPALARQGYAVDTLEDAEDGARLLEQGVYSLVATGRSAAPQGKGESLYQRVARLRPETRRRLFLVLVGDEFKTGDGLQAFTALADLVVQTRDAASADTALRGSLDERQHLYQAYLDALQRHEEAGLHRDRPTA